MSLDRHSARRLLDERIENPNLRRHMLATEAIMQALAERLGEDADAWALAGLLHDLDVEQTDADPTRHGIVAAEELRRAGLPEAVVHAVAAHNEMSGETAQSRLDVALIAADQLSGLITAAVLVRPDKRLADVKLSSLRKRFRESAFARGADRAAIDRCVELGLERDEFLELGLRAMQGVADELGFA